MSRVPPIKRLMRGKKIAQNDAGTIFSRGVATPVSLDATAPDDFRGATRLNISHDGRRCGRCRPCGRKERAYKGLVKRHKPPFSTAPTPIIFSLTKKEKRRTLRVSPFKLSQRRGSPHLAVSNMSPRPRPIQVGSRELESTCGWAITDVESNALTKSRAPSAS